MPECTAAVLYARKSKSRSTRETGNGRTSSSEAQLDLCRQRCKEKGWVVLDEFVDDAVSGSGTANRPEFQDALDAACAHHAALVVYNLSRFARNTEDAIRCVKELEKHDAHLVSLKEEIDTTSAMGRFIFRLFASIAELQRETISESTSDMLRSYQAEGRVISSKMPYGFKPDPESFKMKETSQGMRRRPTRIVGDPEEQDVIKRILAWHEEGYGLRGICRKLTEAGTPPRGHEWQHSLVKRILKRGGAHPSSSPPPSRLQG